MIITWRRQIRASDRADLCGPESILRLLFRILVIDALATEDECRSFLQVRGPRAPRCD
jgi:hypothetical protein